MQERTTRTTLNQPNRSAATQTNRTVGSQRRAANTQINSKAGATDNQTNSTSVGNTVVCRKCKSPQIVANKRGYSFANMFKTLGIMLIIGIPSPFIGWYSFQSSLGHIFSVFSFIGFALLFLSLPVSILIGFVGRGGIVNGCMNCGFKWTPAKRK